jgi:CheY-like chemotaxis protein
MHDRLYCFDRDGKQVRFKVDGKPYDDNPNTSTTIIALTANEIEGDRERCLKSE